MSFTQTDIINASRFAEERTRLFLLEALNRKFPHIASHLEYKIRAADHETDYFFPRSLNNRAIISEVIINKKLCEKLSCSFAHPRGSCTSENEAFNYRVGDSANFQTACQPSCFNLLPVATYNEDGEENPHMTRVVYNENGCVFVPTSFIWSELPLFRSSEIYETRVNDLPLGFNEKTLANSSSGIGYEYNETYCRSFFDEWDPQRRICYTRWYQMLLNVVIGENIVKMARAGITALQNNGNSIPPPINLPPMPPLDPKHLLSNWIKDIDPNFVVPDPNGNNDDIINSVSTSTKQKLRPLTNHTISHVNQPFDLDIINATLDVILALLEALFTDPYFIASIGVDILLDQLLSGIRKASLAIIKRMGPLVNNFLRTLFTPMPSRVLTMALRSTMTRMVIQVAIKVSAQFFIALARIVALAASVVGIILIIIAIFDIIFIFWDPLGFSNKFPPEFLDQMMWSSDLGMRQQFQMSVPRLSFDLLALVLLSEDEILELNLHSFVWFFEYFNALEVNSEGTRINRGPNIIFNQDRTEEFDQATMRLTIPTQKEFRQFEIKHTYRWRLSRYANFLGWAFTAAGLLFIAFNLFVVAFMLLIIAIIFFALAMTNLHNDVLVDNLPETLKVRILPRGF
jgi:hypothetical protein